VRGAARKGRPYRHHYINVLCQVPLGRVVWQVISPPVITQDRRRHSLGSVLRCTGQSIMSFTQTTKLTNSGPALL
jgi:hypothetical protein